jgi:hypothetical protein
MQQGILAKTREATTMSARSEALAQRVEQANSELLAAIEATNDDQWNAKCADGEWTQGFAGYHAAASIGNITGMVKGLAAGESFQPVSFAQIDQINAAFHAEHSGCTKAEALDAARTNSPAAMALVAGLSDTELDREVKLATDLPPLKVEQVVEMLLIGHPTGHKESIVNAR